MQELGWKKLPQIQRTGMGGSDEDQRPWTRERGAYVDGDRGPFWSLAPTSLHIVIAQEEFAMGLAEHRGSSYDFFFFFYFLRYLGQSLSGIGKASALE